MEHFYFFMLAKSVLKTKNASKSASAPKRSGMSKFKAIVKNILTTIISFFVTYKMWWAILMHLSYTCKGEECSLAMFDFMVIFGIPIAIVVFLILLFPVSSLLTKIGTWIGKPVKRKRKPKI